MANQPSIGHGILTGASAANSALVGGHFASLILNWKEDYHARVETLPCCHKRPINKLVWNVYSVIKIIVFLLYVAQDILAASLKRACENDPEIEYTIHIHGLKWWGDGTSFTSHFSGLIVGFLVGLVSVDDRKPERWEFVVKIIAVVLLVAAAIAAIVIISVDAILKEAPVKIFNVDCSHDYDHGWEAIALDVSCVLFIALFFLVFCLLLCTKGKRKMFRTFYARKIDVDHVA